MPGILPDRGVSLFFGSLFVTTDKKRTARPGLPPGRTFNLKLSVQVHVPIFKV